MNFNEIYTYVTEQFGNTSTAMVTKVKRYINMTQQDIASRRNWNFLLKKEDFQCTEPYTTGTVYASGTTLTGIDTVFTSGMVGRKIRIGGEQEYYLISAFTSTTVMTLSQSYTGTYDTLAEATTYSIFQDEYSLASDVEKIIDITNPNQNIQLQHLSRQEFEADVPNPVSSGNPQFWIPAGLDSSGYTKVQLYLIPDAAYVMYYWYRKRLSDQVDDSNISEIPLKYHKLLYLGSLAMCYEYDKDPLASFFWTQYENMITDMIKDLEQISEDATTVLKPVTQRSGGSNLRLPPSHYHN